MPIGAALSGFLIEHIGAHGAVFAFTLWFVLLATVTTFNRHVREARPIAQVSGA